MATTAQQTTVATQAAQQAAAATTVASASSLSVSGIAHDGDGQNREEQSDSPKESAIHIKFLQIQPVLTPVETRSTPPEIDGSIRRRQNLGLSAFETVHVPGVFKV